MTVRAVSIQPGTMSAEDLRIALGALLLPADTLTARTGFLPGCVPTLALAGGLGITVPAFRAAVQGSSSADQGVYMLANDGSVVVTLDPGDAQDRIDLIVAQVRNTSYDLSGANDVRITFVKGTAAAAPTAPALPASSILLGQQRVQAGASAGSPLTAGNLTTVAGPVIAGAGGIRPVSATLGGTADTGRYAGQYRDNNGQLQRWTGSAWDTGLQQRLAALEAIQQPKTGSDSDATSTSSRVQFNHGAPYRPSRCVAYPAVGSNNYRYAEVSISSTVVTLEAHDMSDGSLAAPGQAVTFDWVVFP